MIWPLFLVPKRLLTLGYHNESLKSIDFVYNNLHCLNTWLVSEIIIHHLKQLNDPWELRFYLPHTYSKYTCVWILLDFKISSIQLFENHKSSCSYILQGNPTQNQEVKQKDIQHNIKNLTSLLKLKVLYIHTHYTHANIE